MINKEASVLIKKEKEFNKGVALGVIGFTLIVIGMFFINVLLIMIVLIIIGMVLIGIAVGLLPFTILNGKAIKFTDDNNEKSDNTRKE